METISAGASRQHRHQSPVTPHLRQVVVVVVRRGALQRILLPLPVLRERGGLGVAEEGEGGAHVVGLCHMLEPAGRRAADEGCVPRECLDHGASLPGLPGLPTWGLEAALYLCSGAGEACTLHRRAKVECARRTSFTSFSFDERVGAELPTASPPLVFEARNSRRALREDRENPISVANGAPPPAGTVPEGGRGVGLGVTREGEVCSGGNGDSIDGSLSYTKLRAGAADGIYGQSTEEGVRRLSVGAFMRGRAPAGLLVGRICLMNSPEPRKEATTKTAKGLPVVWEGERLGVAGKREAVAAVSDFLTDGVSGRKLRR
ncbi:hypothetical protein E2C01_026393 [Portunus trituberculatus]|uniref:Uncharacterized protein n=1 Tax=Portunus trituberculatus TaxID=210409 RepID=A0A5B7EKT6_PORTR|nr:hypothetical protein [Portunus trituberculatus]